MDREPSAGSGRSRAHPSHWRFRLLNPHRRRPGVPPAPSFHHRALALVIAIFGFVLGVLPFAAWLAWILFIPALILAIRVLMNKQPGKTQATSAIVIVSIGWLLGMVSNNSQPRATAAASSITTPTSRPSTGAPTRPTATVTPPAPTSSAIRSVGQAVTSRTGVSFTVTGAQCGLGAQDDMFDTVAPKGQFCKIDFVVANGSGQPQDVAAYDVYGYIGNARYQAETSLGKFGEDYYAITVNPGLSVNCAVFFDVPSGVSLDRVKLITSWWGGDGATVTLH